MCADACLEFQPSGGTDYLNYTEWAWGQPGIRETQFQKQKFWHGNKLILLSLHYWNLRRSKVLKFVVHFLWEMIHKTPVSFLVFIVFSGLKSWPCNALTECQGEDRKDWRGKGGSFWFCFFFKGAMNWNMQVLLNATGCHFSLYWGLAWAVGLSLPAERPRMKGERLWC